MNKGDLTLEAAMSLFLMNRESRNYSPKTIRWYSDMLGRFAEWFGAEEKIASINANAIREYTRSVRDHDLSKFTRHAYMRTLKTFLRWLESEGYLAERALLPGLLADHRLGLCQEEHMTNAGHSCRPSETT